MTERSHVKYRPRTSTSGRFLAVASKPLGPDDPTSGGPDVNRQTGLDTEPPANRWPCSGGITRSPLAETTRAGRSKPGRRLAARTMRSRSARTARRVLKPGRISGCVMTGFAQWAVAASPRLVVHPNAIGSRRRSRRRSCCMNTRTCGAMACWPARSSCPAAPAGSCRMGHTRPGRSAQPVGGVADEQLDQGPTGVVPERGVHQQSVQQHNHRALATAVLVLDGPADNSVWFLSTRFTSANNRGRQSGDLRPHDRARACAGRTARPRRSVRTGPVTGAQCPPVRRTSSASESRCAARTAGSASAD